MTLRLFEGYGIELEYMIVDKQSLKPLAIADRLLTDLAGELTEDVELGEVAVSNELALHVIELKGNGPKLDLGRLHRDLHTAIHLIHERLLPYHAVLLPTAMHPTLNPMTDTKLWPHGNREIYSAYDRIFDCRGHGWSNLQSVHINFPFFDDEEFGRLHAAIRLCLPLLPAIAASSPIADGKLTHSIDTRLNVYRKNQMRIPSITGSVVPEACFDRKSYDQMIFQPMFKDIAPFDPEGLLQHEWLNSRGAIARWDRHAIEIRVIDIQESLLSDFAVIRACTSLVRALVEERWISYEDQRRISTESLRDVMFRYLDASIDERIKDQTFLDLFGYQHSRSPTYLELWEYLASELTSWEYPIKDSIREFQHILENGNLSTRIVNSVRKIGIADCYQELHRCLIEDRQFPGA